MLDILQEWHVPVCLGRFSFFLGCLFGSLGTNWRAWEDVVAVAAGSLTCGSAAVF